MLLVVTNKTDLACDYLILRLKERRVPFVRLNTEDLGTRFGVDISLTGDATGFKVQFSDGRALTTDSIRAVYFRQPIAPAAPVGTADSDREFVRAEMREVLRSLWRLIDEEKWLNHPRRLWLASNKIEQLSVAAALGLRVPESLVTCSAHSARGFFSEHNGHVVCKAVKHGFTQSENTVTVATTQRIGNEFFEHFEEYAAVPMIYQREILKAFDIRVIVVCDEVYATAIHSQDHSETEVDWRVWDAYDFDLQHEPITLPESIATGCRRITRHFGLKYSAIDLARGRDGNYYFFEMNPNGQWAWLERKVGFQIRDALIRGMGVS